MYVLYSMEVFRRTTIAMSLSCDLCHQASWDIKVSILCLLKNHHLGTFHLLFYEYFEFGHTTLFTHCFFFCLLGKYAILDEAFVVSI